MGRLAALLLVTLVVVFAIVGTSGAITGGQVDGDGHPNVAMIVFYQADGRFRCSATLVSPTVLVTAAHCTAGVRGKVIATFASTAPTPTPRASDDPGDGMSAIGYSAPVTGWLTGTPHAHPLWDGELQLNDLHDVGVVVLDEPSTGAASAALAPRDYLAGLANGNGGLNKQTFTVVGYGVFFEKPSEGPQKPTDVSDRTRRVADAVGQNISSQTLKLAENAKDSRADGGTCFGDSGGPVFHGGYLVADFSFVASQFCTGGGGGYYRLDTDDARMFLENYLAVP